MFTAGRAANVKDRKADALSIGRLPSLGKYSFKERRDASDRASALFVYESTTANVFDNLTRTRGHEARLSLYPRAALWMLAASHPLLEQARTAYLLTWSGYSLH